MTINTVRCLFEQSGTFRDCFRDLGFAAYDYDIASGADYNIDLFPEISKAYEGQSSIFDHFSKDDLILAFFPCVHFCDAKGLFFRGLSHSQVGWSAVRVFENDIILNSKRSYYFDVLCKLFVVCCRRGFRLVLENPWNPSGTSFLQTSFVPPSYIDWRRNYRGDSFRKPTAFWFVNFKPKRFHSFARSAAHSTIAHSARSILPGVCSLSRSTITRAYAWNFICDVILGCSSGHIQQPDLFD